MKSIKKALIPIHQNALSKLGIEILPINEAGYVGEYAHRDDHFMFVLQQSGTLVWDVDFKRIILLGPSVCFITPGQVHRYVDFQESEGWLIFVDTPLISNSHREIFLTYINAIQIATLKQDELIFGLLQVLSTTLNYESLPLQKPLVVSLIESFTGMVASFVLMSQTSVSQFRGPKYETVINFKKLVAKNYKDFREINKYSELLHITPLYLNEIVKNVTGFPASYWINQEVLLEAKRLLYYTLLDVKQIAHEIGYVDHAYFSRLFKKHTGITALEFRVQNHVLSNDAH